MTRLAQPELIDPRTSRGVTLVEIVAATALLAVMAVLLVPVLGGVGEVRESAAHHQLAVMEAANLTERIAALRAEGRLSHQQLEELSLSPEARDQLVDPELRYTLDDFSDSPPAHALTIEISWRNRHGERAAPVRVVTFLNELEETDDAQP